MRIIIITSFLLSIGFSQFTGNDFLDEYPFNVREKDLDETDKFFAMKWYSFFQGFFKGSMATNIAIQMDQEGGMVTYDPKHDLQTKVIGMSNPQIARILKKWCDKYPT